MASLKFLIDNMCAKFTEKAVYDLVRTLLAERPSTMSDIANKIAEKDRSLDIKSAQDLAKAAVEAMAQSGDIVIQGDAIYSASSIRV